MNARALVFACVGVAAAAAAFTSACVVVTEERAGTPCETTEDCGSPLYECVPPGPELPSVCQLIYPPAAEADAGTDSVGDVFWCDDVEQLMVTYCADCHGEDRSGSGIMDFRLDLYDDDETVMPTVFGAKTKAARIRFRMSDFQDMPPPGYQPVPTDEERLRVRNWALGGARHCQDGGM